MADQGFVPEAGATPAEHAAWEVALQRGLNISRGDIRALLNAAQEENLWLAEESSGGPSEVLGIYADLDHARRACQDRASEYFGAAATPPLTWTGDERHASATYHHPGSGMRLLQITRFKAARQ
jgi:hypothetical protein